MLVSNYGNVLWKEKDVSIYQLDVKSNNLIYVSGNHLVIRDLKNLQSKIYKLDSDVQWISSYGRTVYYANIQALKIELYRLDILSNHLSKQIILSPKEFEFTTSLKSYFEVREDEHFILPLYLKSKLYAVENSELKISYSNRNNNEKILNHHLGIYNIREGMWDYQPSAKQKRPVYKFLTEKGDFILFDQSDDIVEDQQNVVLDLNLLLDYGKSSHTLPKKRIDEGNYFWDRDTEQFIYFDFKRWRCYHIRSGEDHDLFTLNINGWETQKNNGLTHSPEVDPIKIKGMSAIMFSNQFDYFIVDLKRHISERITRGEDRNIKYKLQLSKDQYTTSAWNVKFAEIDLEKKMIFKVFNVRTYDSGFATYLHKKKSVHLYQQAHYKEMIPYKDGFFFTSDFAVEPFKLTKYEKGKYIVAYESLKSEKKGFESINYKIFQYETNYGTSNAALLFPLNYKPQQKYPTIVNIYEKKSEADLLNFLPPYLKTTFGFNYMHYLMNGYIVLLPDLQYETGNVKNSIITSLEKSIDTAKSYAAIDSNKLGIVGLSFGGYETGLALSNSKYFKTGVAGVMVSDLISHALSYSEFNSMPNYRRTENQQLRMKNNVFDDWNNYLENSPIYHLKNVNIPVLIWTGSKDKNISAAQSKMFFLGMKRLQKKAVFLEYANETHNVFLPSNQLDLNIKIWQWFDHYLKNKSAASWISPVTE